MPIAILNNGDSGSVARGIINSLVTEVNGFTPGGTGTVTTLSVASANGFAGSVADPTTTPVITLSTSITGLLKGNGTAISSATAGTDYVIPSVTTLSSLVSVGTITTGTWNGTIISPTYGGTGINNGSKTITLGGNLTTTGAFNTSFTQQLSATMVLPAVATTLLGMTGTNVASQLAYFNDANQVTSSGKLSIDTSTSSMVVTDNLAQNTSLRYSIRTYAGAGLSIPVGAIQSAVTNKVTALDIMPNGTVSDYGSEGVAWLDICDKDIRDNNAPVVCTRLGITTTRGEIGMKAFSGASTKPLYFINNGTDSAYIDSNAYLYSLTRLYISGASVNEIPYFASGGFFTRNSTFTFTPSVSLTAGFSANSSTDVTTYNSSAGASAMSRFISGNGSTNISVGIYGTGYSTSGFVNADRAFIATSAANGIYYSSSNASGAHYFLIAGTGSGNEVVRFSTFNGFKNNTYIGSTTITPNSTLQVGGSFALPYVAKTANYTYSATDYTVDCTANSFTLTLPTAVGITGRIYVVNNTGAGTITLATTSSQTINGAAPGTVGPTAVYRFQSTGANWITV